VLNKEEEEEEDENANEEQDEQRRGEHVKRQMGTVYTEPTQKSVHMTMGSLRHHLEQA
jgi:hypothetical protein